MLGGREEIEAAEGAQYRLGTHAEITLYEKDVVIGRAARAEFLFDELPDFGRGHQEASGEFLSEFFLGSLLPSRALRLHLENLPTVDERGVVAVLEVVAIFVGGRERLAAEGLGRIDQGESGVMSLEKDEDSRDLRIFREWPAKDAAAVELEEGEYVADGLVAQSQAAALFGGHALGGETARVERGKLKAASGRRLEAEIVLAIALEVLELEEGGRRKALSRGPEEDREGRLLLPQEERGVAVEAGGNPGESVEGRGALSGFEEGNEFGR